MDLRRALQDLEPEDQKTVVKLLGEELIKFYQSVRQAKEQDRQKAVARETEKQQLQSLRSDIDNLFSQ